MNRPIPPDIRHEILSYLPISDVVHSRVAPRTERELWTRLVSRNFRSEEYEEPYEVYKQLYSLPYTRDYRDVFKYLVQALQSSYYFGEDGTIHKVEDQDISQDDLYRDFLEFNNQDEQLDIPLMEDYLGRVKANLTLDSSLLLIDQRLTRLTVRNTGGRGMDIEPYSEEDREVDEKLWNKYGGQYTITNPNGITLDDFMTAYYVVKPHKFDQNYNEGLHEVESVRFEPLGKGKVGVIVNLSFYQL